MNGLETQSQRRAALMDAIRSGRCTGLLLLDVAGLAQLNTERGVVVGDEVLATVEDRLLLSLPPGTLVARSGDEYFVAFTGLAPTLADAQAIVEKVSAEPTRPSGVAVAVHAAFAVGDPAALILAEQRWWPSKDEPGVVRDLLAEAT